MTASCTATGRPSVGGAVGVVVASGVGLGVERPLGGGRP